MRRLSAENVRSACVAMYCGGCSVASIAEFLGVSSFIVRAAVLRLYKHGFVSDRARSGRPRVHSARDDRMVKYEAARNVVFSAAEIARERNMPRRSVSNILRASNFRPYKDKNFTLYTRNWKEKRKQLYGRIRSVDWDNVIYSDEKRFVLKPDGRLKIYARSTQELMRKRGNVGVNTRLGIRVWGAVSSRGTGPLIFLKQPWSSEEYKKQVLQPIFGTKYAIQKMLRTRGYKLRRWYFQQDNDPAHKGKAAMNYLKKNHVNVLKWPPRSPDLSPIENIWSIMVKKIRLCQLVNGKRHNEKSLKAAIQQAWDSIPPRVCRNLCYSVPARLQQMKDNKWMPIS